MSEKTNILYLCVLVALSDYDPDKKEVHEIIKISKEFRIDFNVHNAFEEINKRFREDYDAAINFYLGNIKTDKFKHLGKECFKRVALADKTLSDREIRFMILCKKAWGREFFD